jgi:flagellar basal body rod protein FlgB
MTQSNSNEPTYKPSAFSFSKKDEERLDSAHQKLLEKMGRVSKSHIVRAAILWFSDLSQDQQLELLRSSEQNADVKS